MELYFDRANLPQDPTRNEVSHTVTICSYVPGTEFSTGTVDQVSICHHVHLTTDSTMHPPEIEHWMTNSILLKAFESCAICFSMLEELPSWNTVLDSTLPTYSSISQITTPSCKSDSSDAAAEAGFVDVFGALKK